jgi:hypothetical protein
MCVHVCACVCMCVCLCVWFVCRLTAGPREWPLRDGEYDQYSQHHHHSVSTNSLPRRTRDHATRPNGQNRVGDMTHTQRGGLLMHHPSLAPSYHTPPGGGWGGKRGVGGVPVWASPAPGNLAPVSASVKGSHGHLPFGAGGGMISGSRERDTERMGASPLSPDHPASHSHREMALMNELRLQQEENAQVRSSVLDLHPLCFVSPQMNFHSPLLSCV